MQVSTSLDKEVTSQSDLDRDLGIFEGILPLWDRRKFGIF